MRWGHRADAVSDTARNELGAEEETSLRESLPTAVSDLDDEEFDEDETTSYCTCAIPIVLTGNERCLRCGKKADGRSLTRRGKATVRKERL